MDEFDQYVLHRSMRKEAEVILSSREGPSKSCVGSYCGSQEEITENHYLMATKDMRDSVRMVGRGLVIVGSGKVSVCDNGFSGVDTSAHTSEDFGEQLVALVQNSNDEHNSENEDSDDETEACAEKEEYVFPYAT